MKKLALLPLLLLMFAPRAFAGTDLLIDYGYLLDTSAQPQTPGTVYIGQTPTLYVAARNNGPDTARDFAISVSIPPGTTVVGWSGAAGSTCLSSGTVVQCRVPSLAASNFATTYLSVNISVPPSVAEGTVLRSTFRVDDPFDTNPSNNTKDVSATVVAAARLSVTNNFVSTSFNPGVHLRYNTVISNPQTWIARNLLVTDSMSSPFAGGVTYVSRTITGSGASSISCDPLPPALQAQASTCRATTFPALASVTIAYDVITDPALAAGASLGHTSSTTFTNMDKAVTQSQTLSAFPQWDGVASLSAAASVPFGKDFVVSASLRNAGPSDASTSSSFVIALPQNATFVSMTQNLGTDAIKCVTPTPGTTSNITCSIANLPAPRVSAPNPTPLQLAVLLHGTALGTMTSTATLFASNDPLPGNNSATATTTMVTPTAPTDLSLSLASTKTSVFVGDPIVYTLTVTNNGPEPVAAATAAITLPAELSFASVSPSTACSGSSPINCSVGALTAGEKSVLTITTTPTKTSGTPVTTAAVSSPTPDSNTANNSASASITVLAREGADLAVRIAGPTLLVPGRDSAFSITLTNNGSVSARDAAISFAPPAGASLVSLVQTGGATQFTCTANSCRAAQFDSRASATFTAVATIGTTSSAGMVLTAIASATTSTTDVDSTNNRATSTTQVGDAFTDAGVIIDALTPTIAPGELARFRIVVTNRGTRALDDVAVTATLPSSMTLISRTPSQGTCEGTCNTGTLPAGGTAEIIVVARAPQTAGLLTAGVSISAAGDADPSDDSASATVSVVIPRRRVAR